MKAPNSTPIGQPGDGPGGERGSALVITTIVIFMLMVLSLTLMQQSAQRSVIATANKSWVQGLAEAELGIGVKLKQIQDAAGDPASFQPFTLLVRDTNGNVTGTVVVQAEECGSNGIDDGGGSDANEIDVAKVTAFFRSATVPPIEVTVRAYMRSTFHPAFFKAIYVGNIFGVPNTLRLGPGDGAPITYTQNEAGFQSASFEVSERDVGKDLNKDGKIDGIFRMQSGTSSKSLWDNRAAWGLNMERQGTGPYTYRIDYNGDGFGSFSNTRPGEAVPTGSEQPNDLRPQDPNDSYSPTGWEDNLYEDGDYVVGDVYVNGDAKLLDGTRMWGDLDATGSVTGSPVSGAARTGVPKIDPPDMSKITESSADVIVNSGNLSNTDISGRFFSRYTGQSDFYGTFGTGGTGTTNQPGANPTAKSTTTNPNIHLGPSNSGTSVANFQSSDQGKMIYVKGNLWLHNTSDKIISMPKNNGLTLTIVVEGNLYIGDDFQYNSYVDTNGNGKRDVGEDTAGVLFLVKGSDSNPANFVDANKNYKFDYEDLNANGKYDAGDKALEGYTIKDSGGAIVSYPAGTIADSSNIYNGPIEGQGNIYFMDVAYGTGGVTDGFMYAQNNAYVGGFAAGGVTGKDRIYGVQGFLSAGGIFDLGTRTGGDNYFNYKVSYDKRVENGTLKFKGIPKAQGGGWKGLEVHGWRTSGGHRCMDATVGHAPSAATCRGLADADWK